MAPDSYWWKDLAANPEGVYSRRFDIHAKDAWWQVARIFLSLVLKYDHTLCNLLCWLLSQQSKYRYLVNISGRRQTLSSTHSLQITTQSFQFITAFSALELLDLELSWWSFSIAKCSCQSCFLNSEIMSQASVCLGILDITPLWNWKSAHNKPKRRALLLRPTLRKCWSNDCHSFSLQCDELSWNCNKHYSNWFFDRLSIMFRAYSFCNFLNKEVLNLSYILYTGYFALPLNTF